MIKNTASIVTSKVQAAKAKQNDKEAIAELTEIINELVDENAQLQSLAQAYKQELVAQQITENDIEYITNALLPIISKLSDASEKPVPKPALDAIKSLLSKETFNVLQLLGFNFKQAIGMPLTNLVSNLILSKSLKSENENFQGDLLRLQQKLIELAQDPDAYQRYQQLINAQDQSLSSRILNIGILL